MSIYRKIGLGIVFVWFFGGGVGHFITPEFFVSIMPTYLPYHYAAVYISGVFEILGALGILLTPWRQAAGNGLFLLTIAVTPVNIHMWLNPELFPEVPPEALSIRLVVQVMLLICIWKSTRYIGEDDAEETKNTSVA
ncbi:hypothetical protein A9Q99_26850 [Gammaproteobacteria bacterium 45_16_T64]|nr:hypothetical protein A9Q99_26850 [Gammaproteobacteria bacterium 45_16_T64]